MQILQEAIRRQGAVDKAAQAVVDAELAVCEAEARVAVSEAAVLRGHVHAHEWLHHCGAAGLSCPTQPSYLTAKRGSKRLIFEQNSPQIATVTSVTPPPAEAKLLTCSTAGRFLPFLSDFFPIFIEIFFIAAMHSADRAHHDGTIHSSSFELVSPQ